VTDLFDMKARALRRDRAARMGPELFLYDRAFDDCLQRLSMVQRQFGRALLIGAPDPGWRDRLHIFAGEVQVREPGKLFAERAASETLVEDAWEPPEAAYDLIVTVGTLDTVNDLPLALRLIRLAMKRGGLLLGAMSGGDTVPLLRSSMRAADTVAGAAAPHVHPRIEAAALAPLLQSAGFVDPVVDIDRASVAYPSFERLVTDLRAMGATNLLSNRPRFMGKAALSAAVQAFEAAGDKSRTIEKFEILHFAAWAPDKG